MVTPPWELFALLDPAYPPFAALVFLVMAVPVWLYMAWDDMAKLKIRNGLVLFVFAVFVVLGPLLLPLDVYLWQLVQAAIVFVAILVLYAAGTMGGGDAKFIAVSSPYFMREDTTLIIVLFTACAIAAIVTHRLARRLGAQKAVPDWASWTSGKRFQLGFALGGVLSIYLALAAF
ncbi:MAG: prepilin peptidase [Pseudomonadota bacterium]